MAPPQADGVSIANLGIQLKVKQFELLHPGFCLFLIGALISDVISNVFHAVIDLIMLITRIGATLGGAPQNM